MEDIIEKAQKMGKDGGLQSQSDSDAKILALTKMKDQVFQDVQNFVQEREKTHWRNWDELKSKDDKYKEWMDDKLEDQ